MRKNFVKKKQHIPLTDSFIWLIKRVCVCLDFYEIYLAVKIGSQKKKVKKSWVLNVRGRTISCRFSDVRRSY